MCSVPLGLWRYVRDDTHLVGQEIRAIKLLVTMSSRVHLICSWYSMGTLLQACWRGGTEGSVLMVYADRIPKPDCLHGLPQATGTGITTGRGSALWQGD